MWTPRYFILHHTASPQSMREIAALQHYHLVLDERSGRPEYCISVPADRPSTYAAWHHNSDTMHLAVCGDYTFLYPSQQLLNLIVQLAAVKMKKSGIKSDAFLGHCELAQKQAEKYVTECPGKNLRYHLPRLRQRLDDFPFLRLGSPGV